MRFHRVLARIVTCKCEQNVTPEFPDQPVEIGNPAPDVVSGLEHIGNVKPGRSGGHELHEALRARAADGLRRARRFNRDHRKDKGRRDAGANGCAQDMRTVLARHLLECLQPWSGNPFALWRARQVFGGRRETRYGVGVDLPRDRLPEPSVTRLLSWCIRRGGGPGRARVILGCNLYERFAPLARLRGLLTLEREVRKSRRILGPYGMRRKKAYSQHHKDQVFHLGPALPLIDW